MTSIGDRLVEDYLKRLERELGDLRRARRLVVLLVAHVLTTIFLAQRLRRAAYQPSVGSA